jgi:DNA polymerase-3 subunit gamma/tau
MAALATKYRPVNFEDLMGQIQTARALKNSLEFKKLSHAYLFFGSRGVGKTSTARILAASINCMANGVSTKACGKCDNCIEIAEGRNIDVIEMDAASNRGIEHIRDLRENVRFSPMKSKYKIYIIDEVHMLTTESFNALLKTLEEPPEHVIFIMATTEYHKIPETILSRCQAFPFKKFSNLEISARLAYILDQEKIEYEKDALLPVAMKGEGSMRDSISLLDRIISYSGPQKITMEIVNDVLGIIPADLYMNFTISLITRNTRKCLEIINKLYYDGYNLKSFFYDFLIFLKNMLLIKKGLYTDSGYFTESQVTDISKKIEDKDPEEMILVFNICYKLYNNWVYYNTTKSFEILLNIEMAILEVIEKLGIPSVSAIIKKLSELESSIAEGKPYHDIQGVKKNETPNTPENKIERKSLPEIPEDDISTIIQKEFGGSEENDTNNMGIFRQPNEI